MTAGLFIGALVILLIGTLIPIASMARDSRIVRSVSLATTVLAGLLLAIQALSILISGESMAFSLAAPADLFSVGFAIDRLAAFFLLIIATVSSCVALYAVGYYETLGGGSRRNLLCCGTNLFILSMILVIAAANTITFFLFWELMAATSFFLVMYEYDREGTARAGLFYFVMTQLSTLFILLGIILLWIATGSFAFVQAPKTMTAALAFSALLTGFAIKSGIIPFHKWLPYAHPASPSPISALMSGVMLKVAVYGLLRFLLAVFPPELWQGILILAAGTLSAVLGVIYALKEHDLKAMLAYSSIENIGIIFMGIGLFVILSAEALPALATLALLGALFHSLNHALFKSLLFLTSGSIIHASRTRDIEHMGGLIHRMPRTAFLFFCGAIAIAALPPLNGFASEILIFTTFFSSVAVVEPLIKVLLFICLALFALTSALSAACFVKAFGSVFLGLPRSDNARMAEEMPFCFQAGPGVLALACGILGILPFQIFSWAGYPVPVPDMLLVSILLLAMIIVTYAALRVTSPGNHRISETWGCGTHSQQPAGEYTGHGFSEPLDIIFSVVYRTKIRNEREYFDEHRTIFRSGTAEIRLLKVFEEYLYVPVARLFVCIAIAVSRFQNSCLDTYLLYVFVTVIALLAYLGWSA